MMTIKEMSRRTGVSIRTLQYYDRLGLLKAEKRTESGYRLYGERSLERLGVILMYRELQFPLKTIMEILDSPGFDRNKALRQQIEMLELQKAHTENLILMAKGVLLQGIKGGIYMNFTAFDTAKLDEYAQRAKESWGQTPQWQEFAQKQKGKGKAQENREAEALMGHFARLSAFLSCDPGDKKVQDWVKELQAFITEHMYTCDKTILGYLGEAYGSGGEIHKNIDKAGGEGAGVLAMEAIRIYCRQE